ncbi:MAG: YitT family protein [Clostridiales bacterium]|nr:YitT family protein [Clostridiales bacterium]
MKLKEDILYIFSGTFLMAVGVNSFFESHDLVIGGASGLAILLSSFIYGAGGVRIPLWALFFFINAPLFLAGFFVLGFKKLKNSLFSTVLLSFMLWATGFLPEFETDLPIAALFGGIIEGAGLGLILRTDFTTGGSDLLATIINKRLPKYSVSFLILIIDYVIIALGFFEFGSINTFYAIISVYITVKVIDFFVLGSGLAKAVYIISDKSEEIGKAVMSGFERGVTTLKGRGEYTGKDKNIILCVVSKKQVVGVKRLAFEIDPKAFMIITSASEVTGEGFMLPDSSKT